MLRCLSPLLVLAGLCTPLQLHATAFETLLKAAQALEPAPAATSVIEPTMEIYGNTYFSLNMADDMQSNIPRFMMYLMTRYQSRKATKKNPSITVREEEGELVYTFLASKISNTVSILTERAFSWYVRNEDEAIMPFKEILRSTTTNPDQREQLLSSFLEIGDWIKIQGDSTWCLTKISTRKKERIFTFTSAHTRNGRSVEADILLSEISHLFMPLTEVEASW